MIQERLALRNHLYRSLSIGAPSAVKSMCWPWLPSAVPGLRQRHPDHQHRLTHTDYHKNPSNVGEGLMTRKILLLWARRIESYQRKDN